MTVTITHATLTGASADTTALVDGPKWDAAHTVTGLENVDNTSDANKPVSTAQAAADAVVAANAANATNLTSGTVPAAQMPALTGDVTTVAGAVATTIGVNKVTNAKSAQMAAFTLKMNATGSAANATDTDISTLTTKASPTASDWLLISDQAAAGAVKKAAFPSGSGTVTNVATTDGLSGGPITTTGTLSADPTFFRDFIDGLTLSTAGSSATFGIAVGVATDSTNAGFMKLASAYTKTTISWALGTAAGSLDTGAIANSTWYHVFLIKRTDTGVVDVLTSLSATIPTMPTNYTLFRRIGSMKTNGSAQWTLFKQLGDEFLWGDRVVDVNATPTATASTLTTLTVPTNVQVIAMGYLRGDYSTISTSILVTSPDENDQAVSAYVQNVTVTSVITVAVSYVQSRTNTSAQLRFKSSSAGASQGFATIGWVDRRGKN